MLYVFLSLIALSAAMPQRPSTLSNRIVNGDDVTTTDVAPWQVSLQRYGSHFCGGSLIGPNHVMSACHCSNTGTTVVMGTTDYRYPKTSVRGSFTCHPSYNSQTIDYDYSVITLESSVSEDNDIQYIDIADKEYPSGTSAQITGWGKTGVISSIPHTLQVATTTLISEEECKGYWSFVTDRMQCAGGKGNSGCNGDSGGPLAVNDGGRWKLVGNTSWGSSTCNVNTPSAWSKNSAVYSWIQQTVNV